MSDKPIRMYSSQIYEVVNAKVTFVRSNASGTISFELGKNDSPVRNLVCNTLKNPVVGSIQPGAVIAAYITTALGYVKSTDWVDYDLVEERFPRGGLDQTEVPFRIDVLGVNDTLEKKVISSHELRSPGTDSHIHAW
jgi:hypothetical protein